MEGELTAALERLSPEEAFRLAFRAYQHLAGQEGDFGSATHGLLRRLSAGEAEAVLVCVKKMLEEHDEVRLVLAGRHGHAGLSPRETLINELHQLLYWPSLIAAARGVAAEEVRFANFLTAGANGREPDKGEYEAGGRAEMAVLRRTLTAAGRAIAAFNREHGGRAIEPREVALADLRQMATKEYLAAYLCELLRGDAWPG
jgi:hypothetical protein